MTLKEKFESFKVRGNYYKYYNSIKYVKVKGYDNETNKLIEVLKFDKAKKIITHYSRYTKIHEVNYKCGGIGRIWDLIREQVNELGWSLDD